MIYDESASDTDTLSGSDMDMDLWMVRLYNPCILKSAKAIKDDEV